MSDQPPNLPAWPPPPNEPPPPLWKRVLGILLTIAGGLVVGGGMLVFLFAGCVSMFGGTGEPALSQSTFAMILGGAVVLVGIFMVWRR